MQPHTEFESTRPPSAAPEKSQARDLRLVGFAAAFAAAWLAMSVSRKSALAAERKITPQKDDVPAPLRVVAHAVSAVSYPAVYLPVAAIIAIRLRGEGVESAAAVPRS